MITNLVPSRIYRRYRAGDGSGRETLIWSTDVGEFTTLQLADRAKITPSVLHQRWHVYGNKPKQLFKPHRARLRNSEYYGLG